MTTTNTLTAQLSTNIRANAARLADLLQAYDLADLGYKAQRAHEKDIYNQVLASTPFYAATDCPTLGVHAGQRVTEDSHSFLLADADWAKLTALAAPILQTQGLTDADGYYTTDWLTIKGDARRQLVDFIIDTILPTDMRPQFSAARLNIVQAARLIDAIRPVMAA